VTQLGAVQIDDPAVEGVVEEDVAADMVVI
jgi:hypothetical protein